MSYRREPRAAKFPHSAASPAAESAMMAAMASANIPRVSRAAAGKPQVTLTLRDDGGLAVEIVDPTGPRQLALANDAPSAISTIYRILAGQRTMLTAIGLDGAPVQSQLRDWSKQVVTRDDAGEVRTYAARAKLASSTTKSAEELGL